MIRLLPTDPMISGSNPSSANLHLELGELLAFCNSRRRNYEMWPPREKAPGTARYAKPLSVQKFTFGWYVEIMIITINLFYVLFYVKA